MKEMYLCENYYGKFGDMTDMVDIHNNTLHTGDIIELIYKDGTTRGDKIIVNDGIDFGVMGVFNDKFINGRNNNWSIKLVKKYYNNHENKVDNIIIKTSSTNQFIQFQGGKLNIAKAKESGLWIEDDKIFKLDKTYKEIQYKEYTVCGTGELITIYRNNKKILIIINPTPDKLRYEFSYYGIILEVMI